MMPFEEICYTKYNPLSQDESFFSASLKGSQAFEMTIHSFKNYLSNPKSESEMKRRLHDPLA
jgi:hypothetical protein